MLLYGTDVGHRGNFCEEECHGPSKGNLIQKNLDICYKEDVRARTGYCKQHEIPSSFEDRHSPHNENRKPRQAAYEEEPARCCGSGPRPRERGVSPLHAAAQRRHRVGDWQQQPWSAGPRRHAQSQSVYDAAQRLEHPRELRGRGRAGLDMRQHRAQGLCGRHLPGHAARERAWVTLASPALC